jgi:hypothetical protein
VDDSTPRSVPRETLIADALVEVIRMLDERKNTPRIRELRARARFYERAVRDWTAFPPNPTQLDAMFELVIELHGEAVTSGRLGSPP